MESHVQQGSDWARKRINTSLELWWSITPLVCFTDGVLHCEYAAYQKHLACRLATKWQKPLYIVMGWVKTRTQFAIFQAVDLHLRGTRCRIWGLGLQDSAAIGVSRWTINTAILYIAVIHSVEFYPCYNNVPKSHCFCVLQPFVIVIYGCFPIMFLVI